MDKGNPDFWKKVKVGSIITLNDSQTIDEAVETGKAFDASKGLDFEVKTIYHIKESNNLFEWIIFEIECDEIIRWLMIKIVDSEMDIRIYYKPEGVEFGTRQSFFDADQDLFFEPDDKKYIGELEFAKVIPYADDDIGEFDFNEKPGGPNFGSCSETPLPSGQDSEIFATLVESIANADVDNPELLILEFGGIELTSPEEELEDEDEEEFEDEDEEDEEEIQGGLIMILQGNTIGVNDVDVLNV